MIIYKYPLRLVHRQTIALPPEGKVLSIQIQNHIPCLWAMLQSETPTRSTDIVIVGTGCAFDNTGLEYIDTFQIGISVWHVFRRASE